MFFKIIGTLIDFSFFITIFIADFNFGIMKKIRLLFILVLASMFLNAQTPKTLIFGGLTRDYLEYVPATYNGSTPVPVVICLHGFGDNMNNFFNIGMNYIADTANFIVLTPQARYDAFAGGNAWNSGASYLGYQLSQTVNDVGFINALLDTLIATYNIDQSRIYATGFSLGGFMCQRLACESTLRFTAIASVSGTIGTSLVCNPAQEIPVCHFHGTADGTIAYTGNMYGNDAEVLVNYWVTFNGCNITPVQTTLPDLVSDGKTVDHYLYNNGNNGTDVEFYKINNGAHEWLYYPANDITYTIEIWKFFMKYPKVPAVINNIGKSRQFEIYPNPVSDYLIIQGNESNKGQLLQIMDYSGKILYNNTKYNGEKINTRQLTDGIYLLKYSDSDNFLIKKFIVRH